MRIKHFTIKGLYEAFDYDFEISHSDDIFILTGPNGYGKTTILNIIKSLAEQDLYFIYRLSFTTIQIDFDNNDGIRITSQIINEAIPGFAQSSDIEIINERQVKFEWISSDHVETFFSLSPQNIESAKKAHYHFPYEGETDEKINKYIIKLLKRTNNGGRFLMLLNGMSVTMLQSNRLVSINHNADLQYTDSMLTINEVSDKLKDLLKSRYYSYLQTVNSSNSSIFDKLINITSHISKAEYEKCTEKYTSMLAQLHEWGLSSEKSVRSFIDGKEDIMAVYLQELQNNLSVYQEIYAKLLLFKELLENKKFVNKNIMFSPTNGLVARSLSGANIPLEQLSSGEQHEIIMLFYSIFTVSKNSVLLIDEPENSLHVAWQYNYCSEMKRIAENLEIQVIIATHSPQIIGERWDECYDLYGALN